MLALIKLIKLLIMKKNSLIFAISLCGIFANAQTISNGNFESYSSLPSCPSNYNITHANNWNGLKTSYGPNNCTTYTDVMGSTSNVSYFNQSSGGTASCQSGAPRTGNGYVVCQARGFYGGTAFDELIFQSVSGALSSGTQYQFRAYAKANPLLGGINAYLVNQSVGSSATAIMNDVRSQALVTPQTYPTVTGTTGWILYEKVLTVPSSGNYYLVIGDMAFCNDNTNSTLFGWSIDDLEFGLKCTINADAGSNKNNSKGGGCCLCNPSSVQIGTASTSGYSYAWQPTSTLSSGTIAQPYASPCATTVYTLTVTGPTSCITNLSTVTVTPISSPVSCCRIGNSKNETANPSELLFNIYPIPSNNVINIVFSDGTEKIKMVDLVGKVVYENISLKSNELTIDVSTFAKGTYLLTVTSGDKTETKKVIVE